MTGLTGKVALVTGAGSGIGRAIALRLAREGMRVAVSDLDEQAAKAVAREAGQGALALRLDVTDEAGVRAAVARLEAELGGIDVLVNNAGWDKVEPFVESRVETWDRLIAINLKGPLLCAHAVLPGMIARGGGRIVSIASDAGRVGSSGEAVYSAAKAGVIGFSKTLAREVARHGVLVNAVCPGPTDTPLFQGIAQDNPKLGQALARAVPLGRLGRPEDVAGAVAFLASDDAAYVTGQTLSVSGGLTMA
ncbi:MAG: 3-oxoacyl-ACP reductase family protein [Thermodesulfobacteriota bacterium]